MKVKNALLALAAVSAVAAPVAASAGTKASASTGKIASVSGFGQRQSVAVKGKNKADGGVIAVAVLAAGAAGYGLYEALDDKSNGS